jgi:hypothetical protein
LLQARCNEKGQSRFLVVSMKCVWDSLGVTTRARLLGRRAILRSDALLRNRHDLRELSFDGGASKQGNPPNTQSYRHDCRKHNADILERNKPSWIERSRANRVSRPDTDKKLYANDDEHDTSGRDALGTFHGRGLIAHHGRMPHFYHGNGPNTQWSVMREK